jgi:hypothetical protein
VDSAEGPKDAAAVLAHRQSHERFRTQTFEFLAALASAPPWWDALGADEYLAVDDGDFSQLLAALRFLKQLLRGADDPGAVVGRARALPLVVAAAGQDSELLRAEALEVCAVLAVDHATEVAAAGLPEAFLAWRDGASYRLWTRAVWVLCALFVRGEESVVAQLIRIGFVDVLLEALVVADESAAMCMLRALARLVVMWREAGNDADVEQLAGNAALVGALGQFAGKAVRERAAQVLAMLVRGE